jgi:hypothetical protein
VNVYLDIDGTIIYEEFDRYNQPAAHLEQFLDALNPYVVYWLTTHCRDGDPSYAQKYLRGVLNNRLYKKILTYRPTIWNIKKTEAIDFSKPFLWFDNDVMASERADLKKHNATGALIEINLKSRPTQLLEIAKQLQN